MDILQVPSSPDIEVRRKALRNALEMMPSRNIQEAVLFLTKDPTQTQNESFEKVILFKSRESLSLILFSAETDAIFGIIVYDDHGFTENCVVLNDIYIDIMDYINPSYCNETQFHSM
jgi:vesicle coat complex subunit